MPSGESNGTGVARRRKAPRASFRPLMRPCGMATPWPSPVDPSFACEKAVEYRGAGNSVVVLEEQAGLLEDPFCCRLQGRAGCCPPAGVWQGLMLRYALGRAPDLKGEIRGWCRAWAGIMAMLRRHCGSPGDGSGSAARSADHPSALFDREVTRGSLVAAMVVLDLLLVFLTCRSSLSTRLSMAAYRSPSSASDEDVLAADMDRDLAFCFSFQRTGITFTPIT